MKLPPNMLSALSEHGRLVAELQNLLEEDRVYAMIFHFDTTEDPELIKRFPYLKGQKFGYRVMRFRILQDDLNDNSTLCNIKLMDLQDVCVASDEAVAYLLHLWNTPLELFKSPDQSSIPNLK
ncbi:hypothetical protein Pla110_42390 [Polystyrenella longa]|uniref:Uncharacterized protein n=1 Tax=Polystyrenella longa TaxID=2528007 RepID=A0A518CTC1_9PLAN|nr:hypothetical protein [Polystyrenella longa]QDU82481.1 hypothetical protein Pla110_42390 [Polystyrenella longa]